MRFKWLIFFGESQCLLYGNHIWTVFSLDTLTKYRKRKLFSTNAQTTINFREISKVLMKYNNGLMNDCMPALKFLSDCFLVWVVFLSISLSLSLSLSAIFGIPSFFLVGCFFILLWHFEQSNKKIICERVVVIESRFTELRFFPPIFCFIFAPVGIFQ